MKKAELVFIPVPVHSHIISTTEFAKRLLALDERLSITVLVIQPPATHDIVQIPVDSSTRIRCISIPPVDPPSSSKSFVTFISEYTESQKSGVEHAILTEILSDHSVQLIGIVVDLFSSSMIDVAHQFKVPSYLFFTSGAAFLGFMLYLPVRHNQVPAEFGWSDTKSIVSTFVNPLPSNILPSFVFDKDGYMSFLKHGTKFKETKGFIVNTFAELEPHAINSIMMTPPPIYPVGPLLNLKLKEETAGLGSKWDEIMAWLDNQPPSSVVFLCFGSRGSFDAPQLEQIAMALEGSGTRFVWSVRQPPPKDSFEMPSEYENIQGALPVGFLERIAMRGMVCGWARQVEVLAHPAIGGFVSHCGWNSILESLWFGVPVAAWPMYAEQQTNAFQLVHELGLAVELKLDYRVGSGEVVMADLIKRAINCLMDNDSPVRKRVKEMSEKSRKAVVDGGSSHTFLGRLVEDLLGNIEATES